MLPDQGHTDASYTEVMPCDTTVQQVILQQTRASDVKMSLIPCFISLCPQKEELRHDEGQQGYIWT